MIERNIQFAELVLKYFDCYWVSVYPQLIKEGYTLSGVPYHWGQESEEIKIQSITNSLLILQLESYILSPKQWYYRALRFYIKYKYWPIIRDSENRIFKQQKHE